jgi:thymidylate synthase
MNILKTINIKFGEENKMQQYHNLLKQVLENGEKREDRTGVGTISIFGTQMKFDLEEGFPAVTTKRLAWKAVVSELLWFIEGTGDERRLAEILHETRSPDKKTIWTGNAQAEYWTPKAKYDGDLGRVYGVQWRDWRGVDQLQVLLDGLKNDPFSRRHIISAWNVDELDNMALPPCHVMSQYHVSTDNKLSCHMYQRSADLFLGVPFNIASYALFTHMIAHVMGMEPGTLTISLGDAHIYANHIDQVNEQLSREEYPLPSLWLNPDVKNIDDFNMPDIILENYKSHGTIKAEMAV